jgi:hypothetical protein
MRIETVLSRAIDYRNVDSALWGLFEDRMRVSNDVRELDPKTMARLAFFLKKQYGQRTVPTDIVAQVIGGCTDNIEVCKTRDDSDGKSAKWTRALHSARGELMYNAGVETGNVQAVVFASADKMVAHCTALLMIDRYNAEGGNGSSVYDARFIEGLQPLDLSDSASFDLALTFFVEGQERLAYLTHGVTKKIEAGEINRDRFAQYGNPSDLVSAKKRYGEAIEALPLWEAACGEEGENYIDMWVDANFKARTGVVACDVGFAEEDGFGRDRLERRLDKFDWLALELDREMGTDDYFLARVDGIKRGLDRIPTAVGY